MGEIPKQLKPYIFKKGNTLGGRKKGKSLKEYSREYLSKMSDEERREYLNGLDRELIWKMSEGNPHQTEEKTIEANITIVAPNSVIDKINE